MFKHKDNRSKFNKQMRIGYLRKKRQIGEDDVQEMAAEIWKITSEEQQRISKEGEMKILSDTCRDALIELFTGWQKYFTYAEWDWIRLNIIQRAEILSAITATDDDVEQFLADVTPVRLRIRKLTPRECFRLMDVDEDRIDILQKCGISQSAQYKLAGNSIVVACMENLFENLLYPEGKTGADKDGQLSLF